MGPIEAYIRQSAVNNGVDPDIAVRVATSEGGLTNPVNAYITPREASYGPFQLNMKGGVGARALAAGIDPRDPNQWQRGVDYAMQTVAKEGWGAWMGAKKQGITGFMGVNGQPGPSMPRRPGQQASGTGAGTASTAPIPPGTGFIPRRPGQTVSGVGAGAQSTQPTTALPPAITPPTTNNNYFPPAPAPASNRSMLADALTAGLAGFNAAAANPPKLPALPSMNTQNVSLPVQPIIDPQQAANQRQMMAQALARLNAGNLYG